MFIKGTTNFNDQFDREIKRAVRTVERFSELSTRGTRNWWPNVRRSIKEKLISNISKNYGIPVSSWTLQQKKEALEAGASFQRLRTGGRSRMESAEINWRATGTMERVLTQEFNNDRGRVIFGSDMTTLSVGADTSKFIKDESGVPYPEAVDEMLVSRGGVGLGRLTDDQVSDILKMLVVSYEKLADRIFRGAVFGEPNPG